jgi:hypothetical protein
MSSFATAPTRSPESDPPNNKQLRFLSRLEAPTQDDPQAESAAGNPQTTDEATRVERLLSQLEARSMALVPYGYGALRELPAKSSNNGLIAGVLVAIWLSTLVFGVAYIRYNHPSQIIDRAATATPIIIPSAADPVDQRMASSVDHLAKALVSSSERLNAMQAALDRSNRDMQQRYSARVNERAKPVPAPVGPLEIASPVKSAEGTLPRNWHRVLDIKPSDSAVAHRGDDGTLDYWLVPRGADKTQTKVLPIGTSSEGVVVHNLEDGRDYTLTPAGEWRNGAVTPPAN